MLKSLQERSLRNAEHLRVTLLRNSFQESHREFPRTSLGCIQSNAPRQISQAAQCINAYRRAVRLHSRERHMGSRLRGVHERQAWVPGHFPWVPSKAGDQHAPWPAKIRATRPARSRAGCNFRCQGDPMGDTDPIWGSWRQTKATPPPLPRRNCQNNS